MSNIKTNLKVGQRAMCKLYLSGRPEIYFGTIIQLLGVAGARFKTDTGVIVGVFQDQIKPL